MEMTLTRVTCFQQTMQSQRWTKRFVRMQQLWQKNFFQRVDKLLTLQFVALVKILKTERRNNHIFTNELKRKDGVDDEKMLHWWNEKLSFLETMKHSFWTTQKWVRKGFDFFQVKQYSVLQILAIINVQKWSLDWVRIDASKSHENVLWCVVTRGSISS